MLYSMVFYLFFNRKKKPRSAPVSDYEKIQIVCKK